MICNPQNPNLIHSPTHSKALKPIFPINETEYPWIQFTSQFEQEKAIPRVTNSLVALPFKETTMEPKRAVGTRSKVAELRAKRQQEEVAMRSLDSIIDIIKKTKLDEQNWGKYYKEFKPYAIETRHG